MLYLQHMQSGLTIVTCICFDACFIQHDSCMFSCDLLVIHYQNPHIFWIDKVRGWPLMIAVVQCDDNCKFCPDTLSSFSRFNIVFIVFTTLLSFFQSLVPIWKKIYNTGNRQYGQPQRKEKRQWKTKENSNRKNLATLPADSPRRDKSTWTGLSQSVKRRTVL